MQFGIRFEIKSTDLRQISGTSTKSGKPYSIREQEAWAFLYGRDGKPQPYPQRVSLSLGDDQQPYEPGLYYLDPSSIYVGDFGKLMLGRPVLVKVVSDAKKAA